MLAIQRLDSISPSTAGADFKSAMSFPNFGEELDIRAPPKDKYSAPLMQPPQAQHVSRGTVLPPVTSLGRAPYTLGEQNLRAPSFFRSPGSDLPPPDAAGSEAAKKKTALEAEINKIVAEDIDTMEAVNSVRELKRNEPDMARREQLERDEQQYWQRHLELKEEQERLNEQLTGKSTKNRPKEHVPMRRSLESPPADKVTQLASSPKLAASPGKSPSPPVVSGHSRPPVNSSGVGKTNMVASQGPPSQDMKSQYFSTRTVPTVPNQERGSAPSSSSAEGWTCEHCTFINTDATTNICAICDKTSSRKPVMKPSVRQKEPSVEKLVKTGAGSAGEAQPTAATTELPRKHKKAEYFQQLEAEVNFGHFVQEKKKMSP